MRLLYLTSSAKRTDENNERKRMKMMKFTKNGKTAVIVRMVKEGTKRVFFYPTNEEGKRLGLTNFARQYDAVKLAKQYLNQ